MTDETVRARRAFLRVGVLAPLAILALSLVVALVWLPQLPDPVAMHWSGGAPDGFGPRWTAIAPALLGMLLVALLAVTGLFAHRMPRELLSGGGGVIADESGRPQWSVTARFLGATSLGLAAMMALLTLAVTGVQRGLADAAEAPDIGGWALLGFALLVAGTVIGWFLQPRVRTPVPRAVDAAAVPIGESERAAWFGSVSMARSGRIVLGCALAITALAAAGTLALDPGPGAIVLGAFLLLVGLVVTCLFFRVRVSGAGLQVRSLAGWPNTRIALADIERVEVAQIDPFAEFGGWGWRLGLDGRRGVVMRRGEALQVTHSGGTIFVVTVDGAAEAASVLEGLRVAASENPREE